MAYVEYTNLNSPNAILEKIAEYITNRGYTIAQPLVDDVDVYNFTTQDGKKFAFWDRTNTYTIMLRSSNGINIFGSLATDTTIQVDTNPRYQGIGMIVGEGYSRGNYNPWYNQLRVPVKKGTSEVQGAYMPAPTTDSFGNDITYTLYCNNVTEPTDTIVFTIMKEGSKYRQVAHLVYANVNKYDDWVGGAFFSGSSNRYWMEYSSSCFDDYNSDGYETDISIYPICGSGEFSNSFLRIDIDEATSYPRGNIYWACSGTDNITGKKLAMPIRVSLDTNGKIPHYRYLQSQDRLDWGRNVNTLNCITMNMPIFLCVNVDPDLLDNYACAGVLSGLYFVSMLNVQTGGVYEISYPQSNNMCQTFSVGRRRGHYGFDGISVHQQVE